MLAETDKSALNLALDCNMIKDIKKYKKKLFNEAPYNDYRRVEEEIYNHFLDLGYPLKVIREGMRLNQNSYKRRTRCLNKTNNIILDNKNVYFGTLTFNDDVLKNTTIETRRRYVSRYLKSVSQSYIANIDFGDKEKNPESNEREHYHCLIACDGVPSSWSYGFCKFKKVSQDEASPKRITSYINKLTNHALKLERTGKARRLIYSRDNVFPSWLLD